MSTYKEDYELVKKHTIDDFFKFFQELVKRIDTEKVMRPDEISGRSYFQYHDLKEAITDLKINESEDTITFKLLGKPIIFAYDIFPRDRKIRAKIKVYKNVLAWRSENHEELIYIKDFDITFEDVLFRVVFQGIDTDKINETNFNSYLQLLTDAVFRQPNEHKTANP